MEPLQPGISYHIFNHANGFENVFREPENYRFFLEKYWKYISPVAETYAWCLMPNHFHLVVRIRKRDIIEGLILNQYDNFNNNNTFSKVSNFGKGKKINEADISKYLSKQFANLFSSYTQSFNKMYGRKGSLFIKNFKREQITDRQHFITAVIYTHRNPVHHGFRTQYGEWEFSSYFDIAEGTNGLVEMDKLFLTFGGKSAFFDLHKQSFEKLESTSQFEIP
jgi:putative transposase